MKDQTNTVWLRDAFPYRVELCASHVKAVTVWMSINLPDTGDDGDESGWLWDRSHITPTHTHIYSFKSSEHAALFALAWT